MKYEAVFTIPTRLTGMNTEQRYDKGCEWRRHYENKSSALWMAPLLMLHHPGGLPLEKAAKKRHRRQSRPLPRWKSGLSLDLHIYTRTSFVVTTLFCGVVEVLQMRKGKRMPLKPGADFFSNDSKVCFAWCVGCIFFGGSLTQISLEKRRRLSLKA